MKDQESFKPYIPAEKITAEMTATSVIMGIILSVVFGAANAYLGLRVGMTVSASIPAAVISMGVIRVLLKKNSILESNMVQTIGSAGESLAAGAIFTMPALFLWAKEGLCDKPSILEITLIALFLAVAIAFCAVFLHDRLTADHTAPRIVSDGVPLEVSVNATDAELCAGLTAADDRDGDLTDRIIVRRVSQLTGANSAQATYTVFDSASNFCTFTRPIYYTDYHKPRFSLSQPLVYGVGSTVTLLDRLKAEDVLDGDLTDKMRLTLVNLSVGTEGDYRIRVQVTNSAGDTSMLSLTVMIRNRTARHPVITLSDYLVYATGDETPEDYRSLIASVLQSEHGASVDPSKVEISGKIDHEHPGSYDVLFSYTNDAGLESSVILTVVVE